MSPSSTHTDNDTASVLSASSAASYHRRKKAKESPDISQFQVPMSVSDYSDYSRYPRLDSRSLPEPEGPGIRMRSTRNYDDNALPPGYPLASTHVPDEESSRSRRHRDRSSSTASPIVRHEIQHLPHPTAPGGVTPQVVTHVHLPPRPRRRHRSASREHPPTATRPAYGRRRSRSYDDSYRNQPTTHVINLPPPPVISPTGQLVYSPTHSNSLPPLHGSGGYGSGYGGSQAFIPPTPTHSGHTSASSRRRAKSNAYPPTVPTMSSPYSSSPRTMDQSHFSPYGSGSPSTAPGINVVSPSTSRSSHTRDSSGYGSGSSASKTMYPSQSGYSKSSRTHSHRPRSSSVGGLTHSMNAMSLGSNPYASHTTAQYPTHQMYGYAQPAHAYDHANPYGAANIGYGYGNGNAAYGYGHGYSSRSRRRERSHSPSSRSHKHSSGTGFFGGLMEKIKGSKDSDEEYEEYERRHGWRRRPGYRN